MRKGKKVPDRESGTFFAVFVRAVKL